jgi:hypothetical protein
MTISNPSTTTNTPTANQKMVRYSESIAVPKSEVG